LPISPTAAGRVHHLADNNFLEGQIGQNVRNFRLQRKGDKLEAIGWRISAASFPICDHIPRYRWVKGIQHSCKFRLTDAVLMPKSANASSNELSDF
jgi:hypothetical protein